MKKIDLHDTLIKRLAKECSILLSLASYKDQNIRYDVVTPFDNCHNCYSIAKVFTVTAIGMLYDEGKIHTSDKIFDILGKYFPKSFDSKWKNVTIHDLLTHTFGISSGFLDIDAEDPAKFGEDYLEYCFGIKLFEDLATTRVYSDGAYYILARAVSEIAGMDICDYLMPRLFVPLGFREVAWSVCPKGYSMGATGLYVRTDDMIKLGIVYLEGGSYQGKRIVSEEWVETVFERGYELRPRVERQGCFAKGGMYGQMLYIDKNEGAVYAWHAHDRNGASKKVLKSLGM